MLRSLFASALPVVLASCLAAADDGANPVRNPDVNNATNTAPLADDPAPTTAPGAVLKSQDADFIRDAASAGSFEIASSQWVLAHGLSGEPATFARTMISDHGMIGKKLDALLTSKGLTAPDRLTRDDQKQLDALKKIPEDQLGKAYVEAQLAAHQAAVKLFSDEAANGKDADLRAFAAANLDTLKTHLAHAQSVQ